MPGPSPCSFPRLPLGGALALCATRSWSQAAAVGGPCWWRWEVCVLRVWWRVGSALRAALGLGATVGSPETPLEVSPSVPPRTPGVRGQQGRPGSPTRDLPCGLEKMPASCSFICTLGLAITPSPRS
ncbi:hypothetical protein MC885_005066 [Smutsia gigantea]|nr:hypothetical protein MC885_005066 [Smutsia gigantea]